MKKATSKDIDYSLYVALDELGLSFNGRPFSPRVTITKYRLIRHLLCARASISRELSKYPRTAEKRAYIALKQVTADMENKRQSEIEKIAKELSSGVSIKEMSESKPFHKGDRIRVVTLNSFDEKVGIKSGMVGVVVSGDSICPVVGLEGWSMYHEHLGEDISVRIIPAWRLEKID